MVICPITRDYIEEKECSDVCQVARKEGKVGQADIARKFKRVIAWKSICKTCRHHK